MKTQLSMHDVRDRLTATMQLPWQLTSSFLAVAVQTGVSQLLCASRLVYAALACIPYDNANHNIVCYLQPVLPAHALLTAGDPIKNAQAILRYALPIDNKPMRQIQVCSNAVYWSC